MNCLRMTLKRLFASGIVLTAVLIAACSSTDGATVSTLEESGTFGGMRVNYRVVLPGRIRSGPGIPGDPGLYRRLPERASGQYTPGTLLDGGGGTTRLHCGLAGRALRGPVLPARRRCLSRIPGRNSQHVQYRGRQVPRSRRFERRAERVPCRCCPSRIFQIDHRISRIYASGKYRED